MDISEFEQIASTITAIKSRNDKLMSDQGAQKDVIDDILARLKALEDASEKASTSKTKEPPATTKGSPTA